LPVRAYYAKLGLGYRPLPGGGGMIEKFNDQAKLILRLSLRTAHNECAAEITTRHLLIALMIEAKSAAAAAISELHITQAMVEQNWESDESKHYYMLKSQSIRFSKDFNLAMKYASIESKALSSSYIGPEHLLLGILRLNKGYVMRLMTSNHIDVSKLRARVMELSESHGIT
jgi:ATP-dependent Clp protease ATP-binding subunit ClpC